MDLNLLAVALIAGLAFWVGSAYGFRHGLRLGIAEAAVRRRLDSLAKPWER